MSDESREVAPGRRSGTVRSEAGQTLTVPEGWDFLQPGDSALTRRVKKAGPSWVVKEKRGRKTFSRGLWAPAETIASIRADLEVERADPAYARKLESSRRRRERQQEQYAEDFRETLLDFLSFDPVYSELEERLAQAIADHAVPVGSGTVARTTRIPIERRAEAATIAWLRHATTAYDHMRIPRIKGKRREVRRMLAERSRMLLDRYRRGEPIAAEDCPLLKGLPRNDKS